MKTHNCINKNLFLFCFLFQSITIIFSFPISSSSSKSCSTIRRSSSNTNLSIYNRDYYPEGPPPPFDLYDDRSVVNDEYFDDYPSNHQHRLPKNFNAMKNRGRTRVELKDEQRLERKFNNNNRQRPHPRPGLDRPNQFQSRLFDNDHHSRLTSPRRNTYNDILRRSNSNVLPRTKQQRQRRSTVFDPIQRNHDDPILRNGSSKDFYRNNISNKSKGSGSKRYSNNDFTKTQRNTPNRENMRNNININNNHNRRIPNSNINHFDSRYGKETVLSGGSNTNNKPSATVQNGRRSQGMVGQGYVDDIKSRKSGGQPQQSNNGYTTASDTYNNPKQYSSNKFQNDFSDSRNNNQTNTHEYEYIAYDNNSNEQNYDGGFQNDILSKLNKITQKLDNYYSNTYDNENENRDSQQPQKRRQVSRNIDDDEYIRNLKIRMNEMQEELNYHLGQ